MTTDRLVRADAARNREKILETARSQITAHGPDVGMGEIARAAGVAVGTLYRHFPTKTDLVRGIVAEHVEKLTAMAQESLARIESGQAEADHELLRFMRGVLDASAEDRALKAAALALHAETACSQTVLRAISVLDRLVAAGRDSGRLRADLSSGDVVLLASTGPFDHPAESRDRWLQLVMPGLLAQS